MVSELSRFDPEEEVDLFSLVEIAWRQRLLVLGTALGCAVLAVAVAFLLTPIYRAEVVAMEVQDSSLRGLSSFASQLGGLASLAGVNLSTGQGPGEEARAVLSSRHLAEEFVKRNHLERILLPNGDSTLWFAVRRFRDSVLNVREDKLKDTITISIEWEDPGVAAHWANDFVALANELMRARAANDAAKNIAYLTKEIGNTNSVEVQRAMYDLIETETKTLMLANARAEYALTIIDPAVIPELRVKPRRTLIVVLATIFGGLAGVGLSFARDVVVRRRRVHRAGALQ